jgi:NAD(P)-dependent dehydrogenase (short-subunit alcohol dehydrogenase family)
MEPQLAGLIKQHVNHIDILINNAGTLINKSFDAMSADEVNRLFSVNYTAPALLIKNLLPLLKAGKAHIVNITSMGGVQGSVKFAGLAHYSASKAALAVLTECLAEEYKNDDLVFNALALGSVQTEMLAEAFPNYKAPVTPEQMGAFIANFAINGRAFFNGKIIPVSITTP